MNSGDITLTIVRQGQYRPVKQRVRYRQGRAHQFLCPNCACWHELAEGIYDHGTEAYHGTGCAGGGSVERAIERANHARSCRQVA